ncbi:MAG: cytochrome c peroxidase, partial [Catalinimonas sp.]
RRLQAHATYPARFEAAFGHDTVTAAAVGRALAQYVRTLVSDQSRWDAWRRGEATLTKGELRGWKLFEANCASCHPPGLFTDNVYHNLGLDDGPTDREGMHLGRYRITFNPADRGAFKTPTLRNVALTAPYGHDGRFTTLDAMLDHHRAHLPAAATLTNADLDALKEFLRTLTDTTFGV